MTKTYNVYTKENKQVAERVFHAGWNTENSKQMLEYVNDILYRAKDLDEEIIITCEEKRR